MLAASDGVLRLRSHRASTRTIQRAAQRGIVVAVLPGVFVRAADAGDPLVRIRAACAWSSGGVVHGRTALEVHLGRPVTLPIQLCADYAGRAVRWLTVGYSRIPASEQLWYRGVRIATLAYAAVEVSPVDGGDAIFEALRRRLITTDDLERVLPCFAGSPGNRRRALLVKRAMRNPWSVAEATLHELLEQGGIAGWVANAPMVIAGQLVFPDMWFSEQRLVVEFDGEEYHVGHARYESDRRRLNLFAAAGIRVLRFTWEALTQHPEAVVATVKAALAHR